MNRDIESWRIKLKKDIDELFSDRKKAPPKLFSRPPEEDKASSLPTKPQVRVGAAPLPSTSKRSYASRFLEQRQRPAPQEFSSSSSSEASPVISAAEEQRLQKEELRQNYEKLRIEHEKLVRALEDMQDAEPEDLESLEDMQDAEPEDLESSHEQPALSSSLSFTNESSSDKKQPIQFSVEVYTREDAVSSESFDSNPQPTPLRPQKRNVQIAVGNSLPTRTEFKEQPAIEAFEEYEVVPSRLENRTTETQADRRTWEVKRPSVVKTEDIHINAVKATLSPSHAESLQYSMNPPPYIPSSNLYPYYPISMYPPYAPQYPPYTVPPAPAPALERKATPIQKREARQRTPTPTFKVALASEEVRSPVQFEPPTSWDIELPKAAYRGPALIAERLAKQPTGKRTEPKASKSKQELIEIRKNQMKRKRQSDPIPVPEPPKSQNVELLQRLATGEKARVSKREMYRLTAKFYQKLPEVQKKEQDDIKREELRQRLQQAKQYDRKRRMRKDN